MPIENPLHDNLYFEDDATVYSNMIKNVPPKVGEYAYCDSRLTNDFNSYRGIALSKHYLIDIVPGRSRSAFGCHFSSPENRQFNRYVTNHGVITYVKSM